MNFNNSIYENKRQTQTPFLAAHRGSNGANIPCNTLLSYKIAVDCGADIVEIDVAKSKDGEYFAFHPGMEFAYLKTGKLISDMTTEEVLSTSILNCDEAKTHYRIPRLSEVFALLKDKAYINVDKFWTDISGISDQIRKAGVEKQVILKTSADERYFDDIERYASDMMYMPVVQKIDNITEKLKSRDIRHIGVEVVFGDFKDKGASEEYIKSMHERGLLVWANSIIYDECDVLSAGCTDDISLEKGGDYGWGKLHKVGFDIIQTDWLLQAKLYFQNTIKE